MSTLDELGGGNGGGGGGGRRGGECVGNGGEGEVDE